MTHATDGGLILNVAEDPYLGGGILLACHPKMTFDEMCTVFNPMNYFHGLNANESIRANERR